MYTKQLMEFGLAKNEAQIYEALIENGELSVGEISIKSHIHRRNVYDCLNRLLEKGFVFEIVAAKENHYKAVNPQKLNEILDEKRSLLESMMPDLQKLYKDHPHQDDVCILKGVEGYKTYMNEILKKNEDVYGLDIAGLWDDPKIQPFLNNFLKLAKKQGIKFHGLYDNYVKTQKKDFANVFGNDYKFIHAKYTSGATVNIFGKYVVILTKGTNAQIDDDSMTVIINRRIADAFRVWFQIIWDATP